VEPTTLETELSQLQYGETVEITLTGEEDMGVLCERLVSRVTLIFGIVLVIEVADAETRRAKASRISK